MNQGLRKFQKMFLGETNICKNKIEIMKRSEGKEFDGMNGELKNVRIEERYTESEKTMTESDLLGLMEKYGIGTDASMATHIKNIIGIYLILV